MHPWKRMICCPTCSRMLTFLPHKAQNVVTQFESVNAVAIFDIDLLRYQQANNSEVINLPSSFTDYVLENQEFGDQLDEELEWNIEIERSVKHED